MEELKEFDEEEVEFHVEDMMNYDDMTSYFFDLHSQWLGTRRFAVISTALSRPHSDRLNE